MAFENRILAVINPASAHQIALDKAINIAKMIGGELTALIRKEHTSDSLLQQIDRALSSATLTGLHTRLEISEEGSLLRAILRCQHQYDIDLVVKQPHSTHSIEAIFVPDDWKILRNARCPVLMIRDDSSWIEQPVLMAIDASPRDIEHALLNERILSAGDAIKRYANTPLHLVSAFPAPMQDAYDPLQQSESAQCQKYRAECERLIAEHSEEQCDVHLEQGPAELMIPERAKALDAKLVILGTVARSGLKGALLGNTAEKLLAKLNTNLLVLPPANPVDRSMV